MKQGRVRFEFLKTNKGKWVINYESPDVGFNLHGKPVDVIKMYEKIQDIYPRLPESYTFITKHHFLIETEVTEDDT